ncbi:coiled-coil domain-containing protein 144B-like [Sphaeramia orbicularis]|uniref:coiled-coil domain-containing protein 144B-like n=1 Tax=Sphaeramia orbicularis TaxID=375764 RepID=UPI00117E1A9F|nr:coiled-coil domain-containing protein 144B-like [Sphaeramia orbicularis]
MAKEGDDTVDVNPLDVEPPCPSGHPSSDNDEQDHDLRDHHSPEDHGELGSDIPWENRYEKLWVEVEKKEMKSTFKSVAGELKARFGELFKSNRSTAEDTEQEHDKAECSPVEDDSSDEEEGEVIVRPTARARSTVLLTIPEQRESGLEDSMTESADHSLCEDRMEVCAASGSETNKYQEPEQLTDEEERRSSSPQPPMEDFDHDVTTDSTDGHAIPTSVIDHCTVLEDNNTLAPFSEEQLEKNKNNNSDEAELKNSSVSSEEDPEEFTELHPTPQGRSASVPGVSDEELEEDMERFKLEVGMLKVVFLDLEKEKAQLQKEVEDGRPFLPYSLLDRFSFLSFYLCISFCVKSLFNRPKLWLYIKTYFSLLDIHFVCLYTYIPYV